MFAAKPYIKQQLKNNDAITEECLKITNTPYSVYHEVFLEKGDDVDSEIGFVKADKVEMLEHRIVGEDSCYQSAKIHLEIFNGLNEIGLFVNTRRSFLKSDEDFVKECTALGFVNCAKCFTTLDFDEEIVLEAARNVLGEEKIKRYLVEIPDGKMYRLTEKYDDLNEMSYLCYEIFDPSEWKTATPKN